MFRRILDVKQATGRDMSQWTKADIEKAVQEVRSAGGDPGKFLTDIAEENPTVQTVEADIQDVMTAAENAWQATQNAAGKVLPAIEEGVEEIEEECGGGGCIPPP